MGVYDELMEQLNEQRRLAGAPPIQKMTNPTYQQHPPQPTSPPQGQHQYLHEGPIPTQQYPQQQQATRQVHPAHQANQPRRPHSSADIQARLSGQHQQMTPQEAARQKLLRERAAIDAQLQGMGGQQGSQQGQQYLREDLPNPYMGHQHQSQYNQRPPINQGASRDIVMEAVQAVQMLMPRLSNTFASQNSGLEVAAADAPPTMTHNYDPFREAEPDRDIHNYFHPGAALGIGDQVPFVTQVRR